jgi:hypothetical protein
MTRAVPHVDFLTAVPFVENLTMGITDARKDADEEVRSR